MALTYKQMGKGGHVLTFPVNHGKTLNVVAFHTTSSDWPDSSRLVGQATREDALRDFAGFGDTVTSLLKLATPTLQTVSAIILIYRAALTPCPKISGLFLTWERILRPHLPKAAFAWLATLRTQRRRIMAQVRECASKMPLCWPIFCQTQL